MNEAIRAIATGAPPRHPGDLACTTRPLPTTRVDKVASADIKTYRDAWADLCQRALEPNVFLDPAFALPLVGHVKRVRAFDFLVVWQTTASSNADRMIGLLPVRIPRLTTLGRVAGFRDKLVCLGTPLLDAAQGRSAFEAMLDWLAKRLVSPVALTLTSVSADGPFMSDIVADLGTNRAVEILASYRRAVLRRNEAGNGKVFSLQSAKSRKERKRQRRRLAEQGQCAYVSARTPDAVAGATERFLALEEKGWKGERRTALLARPATAAFARNMTQSMVRDGRCRIDSLELDGAAVAMGIVLTSGECAYFWKTAFDENLAPLSPGVQFAMDLAEAQLGDPGVATTDSCAAPDHPMIDRLWPDRLRIVDLAIALKPGRSPRLSLAFGLERTERRARAWAKRLAAWLRRPRTR